MPSTEQIRQVISEIWVEVLGIDPPTPQARFFAVGGDSITCVRFVALARKRGLHCSLRDVLEDDELASLAARVRSVEDPA